MAHITLPPGLPGIIGPMAAYPETEVHLNGLAHALLRGPSSLTPAERETIATYVSAGNECYFCTQSHAAAARYLLGDAKDTLDNVVRDMERTPVDGLDVSPKMKALLTIADKVRVDGRSVTDADVQEARNHGADDKAIHDTVLIAAAFCMFNRYVDGLATFAPQGAEAYTEMGAMLGQRGYVGAIQR